MSSSLIIHSDPPPTYQFTNTPFAQVLNACWRENTLEHVENAMYSLITRFAELTRNAESIIIVEGLPCAGKTTALNRLAKMEGKDIAVITEPKSDETTPASAYWDTARIECVDKLYSSKEYKPLVYAYNHSASDPFGCTLVQHFVTLAKLRKCIDVLEALKSPVRRIYIERFIFADLLLFPFIPYERGAHVHDVERIAYTMKFLSKWAQDIKTGFLDEPSPFPTVAPSSVNICRCFMEKLDARKFEFVFKGVQEFEVCFERLLTKRLGTNKGPFNSEDFQQRMLTGILDLAALLKTFGFKTSIVAASDFLRTKDRLFF